MNYNPNIHHRKSIRLKNYDYSQEGLYFITICTESREKLLGEIVGAGFSRPNHKPTSEKETSIMKLNEIGIMV